MTHLPGVCARAFVRRRMMVVETERKKRVLDLSRSSRRSPGPGRQGRRELLKEREWRTSSTRARPCQQWQGSSGKTIAADTLRLPRCFVAAPGVPRMCPTRAYSNALWSTRAFGTGGIILRGKTDEKYFDQGLSYGLTARCTPLTLRLLARSRRERIVATGRSCAATVR